MGVIEKDDNKADICESLWNEYEPELRKQCEYKLSGCKQEADDVIGDLFLALCDAIDREL